MMSHIKRPTLCALILLLLLCVLVPARVQATDETEKAKNISGMKIVTASNGIPEPFRLFDGNIYSSRFTQANATLTLEYEDGIGSLYLLRTTAPGGYTVTDNTSGTTVTAGQTLLLHDFADLVALFG